MTAQLGVGFDFDPDGSLVVVALLDEGRVAKAGDFKVGDLWIRVAVGDAPAEPARQVIEEERSLDAALTIEILRDGKLLSRTIPPLGAAETAQIRAISQEAAAAEQSLEALVLASMRLRESGTESPLRMAAISGLGSDDEIVAEAVGEERSTVVEADLIVKGEAPPSKLLDDPTTPFGARPFPPGMPPEDQRFYENSGRGVSYQVPDYDWFGLPDRGAI
jgi:hypothetical protein